LEGVIIFFDNSPVSGNSGSGNKFGSALKLHFTRMDLKDCASKKSLLLSENNSPSKEIMMFKFPLEDSGSSLVSMNLDLEKLHSDMDVNSLMRLLFIFLYNHNKGPDVSISTSHSDQSHSVQTEVVSNLVSQYFSTDVFCRIVNSSRP
jgi:hypothetical protein